MTSKTLLSVCFFVIVGNCFAQNKIITFKLEGQLAAHLNSDYAYFYLFESKRLLKTKIQNRQFNFLATDTLGKKELSFGELFLSNDSSDRYIPLREIVQKNINRRYRSVVIEEGALKVFINGDIRNADIENGKLNYDFDEMKNTVAEGRYEEYVEKNPDSPFSLLLINALAPLTKKLVFNLSVDCQELFDKLSNRLKKSVYGIEVQEKIKAP